MAKKTDPTPPADPMPDAQGNEAPPQIASVGRIVHVYALHAEGPDEGPYPAIVTEVDPDDPGTVTVTCFPAPGCRRNVFGHEACIKLSRVSPLGTEMGELEGEQGQCLRWGWPARS